MHWLLYAAFFAVPLSGWAYSSAAGFPIVWFGVLPLPDFVGKDKELAESLKQVHQFFAYGLGLLVLAHLGAVRSSMSSSTRTACCGACSRAAPERHGDSHRPGPQETTPDNT